MERNNVQILFKDEVTGNYALIYIDEGQQIPHFSIHPPIGVDEPVPNYVEYAAVMMQILTGKQFLTPLGEKSNG